MKKIIFVITKSNWGGAQRYVYNMATALPKETYEVIVALGGTGAPGAAVGELEARLRSAGIRTVFIQSFTRDVFLGNDLRAVRELRALFAREKPDIVHLSSSKAGGVGALAARLSGVPNIIFTSHGLAWDEDRGSISRLAIYLLSQLTFVLCHHIITISTDNYARAIRGVRAKQKFSMIHNGLPALSFLERNTARAALAEKAHVPLDESLWIGTVAELTPNKSLTTLTDAVALLPKESPVQVYIIGGGEQAETLQQQIKDKNLSDRVHMTGFIPDAFQYLPALDIFALTSIKEGLPYVLLEAGQAGLPVVSTDIAGALDIVVDKESGLLVPPKNPARVAAALQELIDHPGERRELGSALQRKVSVDFSIEHMVRETTRLYMS